jgi:ABC-type dipeptide/oligopeptide/nickel transport system permease subunit
VVGLVLLGLVLAVAFLGPYLAPYGPTEILCIPYQASTPDFPLGCDAFGHDVLSRVLSGGRTVILLGVTSTLAAYVIGAVIGLVAGYRGGRTDAVLMRGVDVLLAFPPILLLLVLATGAGAGIGPLLVGIVLVQVPGVSRVVRGATLETATRAYVEAAIARGERLWWVLRQEILPNITTSLVADAGTRLTASILLVAAMNFLGLGLRPPASDWALMISENRSGLTLQPLSVAVPAALIALLTISVNLVADSTARAAGRSLDVAALRR